MPHRPSGKLASDPGEYVHAPELQSRLYKRTLAIVVFSQMFGGAGLAAGVTVGALLAQDMLGTESLAGIPSALITLGSAAAALLVGRLSQRLGRRYGLAAGFLAGGLGAAGVVLAAVLGSVALLFASLLVYGAGTATNLQARYAGTDLAKPAQRATAVSIAMVSTTFGAVAGPNLVEPMGRFATSLGIPALAGPFLLAGTAFLLAGLIFLLLLRPDPLLVAQAIAEAESGERSASGAAAGQPFRNRGVLVGTAVMVLTQIVMVAVMTMTPPHMKNHGHGLSDVGLVIGIHIGAMYLPSLVTGMLVDKLGRTTMSIASGVILLAAGTVAAAAPADSLWSLVAALALLGLGWNFGLISGTALIIDATSPATRAKTQGTLDVLVALAGASGGALSGMVVAHSSYAVLSLAGGFLSLLLVPVVLWFLAGRKAPASETTTSV
ncbi:tetracycline resistance protein [Paenibacillus sp. J31TS4]|uniref:MFS transporter n=1 Tax=Paenibacillus sp. J31TS4 TaxID=2807195 RepID=UPI001B1A7C7F|nr:MFS transporter [Paenibacillus sp. J31TS4]GIP39072.1 tetracycline resistance protein [Paenibacillus sp. J31TS4]